ncbi:uncharacterized protein with beta-barrel porin domain [Luteibacter sp. OK325]|uniref:autotransporter outer membrane beta-barrel domain-containing protein n=1 Tax=Luteibacter sp. OK325 TaxID=2135670 RepID=UPI000D4BFC93|nr:autotransporter outer membrane beta-barrel domain-containing protein [Luteibacter sp. OK325]PTR34481.1 uncharacterized protein with beta-barrel porin domain [Luteibacter sp. OK325]
MKTLPHRRSNGPDTLRRLARRPLSQALAFLVVATLYSGDVLATPGLPTPNVPAVNVQSIGNSGLDETGVQGSQSTAVYYGLSPGDTAPSITMISAGGQGGTGSDGGNPTGNGGQGGDGNLVELTIGSGAWVNSTNVSTADNANAAVWLQSLGGDGATAGKMSGNNGHPGQPGGGGSSYGVLFDQFVTVASSSGWNNSQPGTTAVLMQAIGGDAANPLPSDGASGAGKVKGAAGNTGGNGGYLTYNLHTGGVSSQGAAVVLLSQGGKGGDGTGSYSDLGVGIGGIGGAGGNGGDINVTVGAPGASTTPFITAVGAPTVATGAIVPIDASGGVAQAAVMAAGIQAQSIGGLGGNGGEGDGTAGSAGAGGGAGNAGNVSMALNDVNISTSGFAAAGVLAQSIGGAGGNGSGAGGMFSKKGGNGAAGGTAGVVSVTMGDSSNTNWPSDLIATTGDDSMGVVAQSIGGGGGSGGSVEGGAIGGGVSIGGDGESGGASGTVTLNNGSLASGSDPAQAGFIIATNGTRSSGLVAQSIGGGGGTGGSSTNASLGPFSYTVGGTGGTGGEAGTPGTTQVSLANLGIVSTTGDHAKGVVAQAVGGGGGDGGGATSYSASAVLDINVTVGGNGGSGGSAGDVIATNQGQILTGGSDAWGLLAQSIAGGGGNGGASLSDAFAIAPPDMPTVVINTSVGGKGGDGSPSGNVTATNDGVIMTAGAAAHGVLAQSVAGGGGNGGDSSVITAIVGPKTAASANLTVSLGGSGGNGGAAGNVTVTNTQNSLVWTLGDSSDAIFAQSVGGGGGSGGTSKDTATSLQAKSTSSASISLGGSGGSGANGGGITVTNAGNLLTIGDGANGIFAQSVGGGGGLFTGGTIKSAAGKQNETMTLSGGGGEAGNGGTVSATNNATIVTYGGDAAGMFVQSVGGGGGKAGTGTTAGLPTSATTLADYLAASTVLNSASDKRLNTYAGVQAWGPAGWYLTSLEQMEGWAQDYLTYAAAHPSNDSPDTSDVVAAVVLNVGGGTNLDNEPAGSSTQGDGGNVAATNAFTVQTFGPASPGILAQSVGAGGGVAGATTVTQTQNSNFKPGVAFKATNGGKAYNFGNGGAVTATNTGTVGTAGDASFGVLAQSVGGGGGHTLLTASNYASSGSDAPIQISLAGSLGTTGDGGAVSVTNNGSITTAGNDAVGIVAQSVGGGGGDVVVMQTAATQGVLAGLSSGVTNPLADPKGSLNAVSVGSNAIAATAYPTCKTTQLLTNACGDGGDVNVTTSAGSSVSTAKRDAHGVLAQSIGGGGGWIVGLTEGNTNPFNNPLMIGDGGNISMTLGGSINTLGDGAYGVLAQTVGAGGVLAGDFAAGATTIAFPHDNENAHVARIGAGGNITIDNTGSVSTSGANAHAIFAQSVGGGGGYYATTGGVYMGSSGGSGNAGTIVITNSGTVQATGKGSSAVYVDSQGYNGNSLVAITNTGGATIMGNISAPAIVLAGGNSNGDGQVSNYGTINGLDGTAIAATSTALSFANATNYAGGAIYGDVSIGVLGNSGKGGTFDNQGYWGTNGNTTGNVINSGTLEIGGANSGIANADLTSNIDGNLTNTGAIKTNVDFYNRTANHLAITGKVNWNIGSNIAIVPKSLMPETNIAIVDAVDFQNNAPSTPVVDPGGNYLFNYTALASQSGLLVSADAVSHFSSTATQAQAPLSLVAEALYLDRNWNSGMSQSLAQTYASLASVKNSNEYITALTNIADEGSQAASVAHVVASNAFVERMNSCPRFEDGGLFQREHDCAWGRVISNSTDRDAGNESVGYHQNGQVFQLGGQKEVDSDWFVGGSVSSDHSDLDTKSASDSINGSGWTAGAVVKHQMGDWLVSAALEGGEMSYTSTRQAQLPGLGGAARASFDVSHWGLHSRISRQFAFASWYLKPYMDLHATRIDSDGYTEKGAGPLDLHVAASHSHVLGASPMIEAGSRFAFTGGMALQVYAGLGGSFYSQNKLGTDMQFADAPGPVYFHMTSDMPQDRLKGVAGVDLKASKDVDIRLEYQGEFASHFQSNSGALKFTYKF